MRLSAKLNQKLRQRYKPGAAPHPAQDKAQAFVGIDTVRLLPHFLGDPLSPCGRNGGDFAMRSESSRHQRKWRNGLLGLVATVVPIAAYADLTTPWPSRPPSANIAGIYRASAPKFVAPIARSMLANSLHFPERTAALMPHAPRKRVVTAPPSKPSDRPQRRKTPMTLALILMVQAQ